MRAIRTLLIAALAATGLAIVPASPARAAVTIQPGVYIETSIGLCTANFVYDGTGSKAGITYIGTAAHCIDKVGDDVKLADSGEVFGDVAAFGSADGDSTDWALIQIRSAFLSRVSAAVKGHPQYPTGVTTHTQTIVGDAVQLSGYGLGFSTTGATREKRVGTLSFDDPEVHAVAAPIIYGDSGGPLVHIPTGRALGLVSRLCIGTCTEIGPTIEGTLAKAAAKGFTTSVRTV